MDALLADLKIVSEQFLPILGALALIFLCIFIRKLWILIDKLTATVVGLDPTLKKVDQSMEKIQVPLDTIVKVSGTVDQVQKKAGESVEKVADYIANNTESIKDFVHSHIPDKESEPIIVDTYPDNTKEEEDND